MNRRTRRSRQSVRLRYTISTAVLIAAIGASMLAVLYFLMSFVPDYEFGWPEFPAAGSGADWSSGIAVTDDPVPMSTGLPSTGQKIVGGAQPDSSALIVSSASEVQSTLLTFSAGVLVVLTSIGAVASWILSGRMLKPLRVLTDAAERVEAGSWSHRVHRLPHDDEFQELGTAFNSMLDEVESALEAHQRFAANASHELQTPLSTTKALLEVAGGEHSSPRVQELVTALTNSNDRLIDTTDALLNLAVVSHRPLAPQPVELADVIEEEMAALGGESLDLQLHIELDLQKSTVEGDHGLLVLLVGNLLRNAVRHNVEGGRVTVRVRADDDSTSLIVRNSGPVVPPAIVDRLTEPFYRAEERVRPSTGPRGHGLGLALVRSIADAHGATLDLSAPASGGLAAVVTFRATRRP